jgi:hypothetical protein
MYPEFEMQGTMPGALESFTGPPIYRPDQNLIRNLRKPRCKLRPLIFANSFGKAIRSKTNNRHREIALLVGMRNFKWEINSEESLETVVRLLLLCFYCKSTDCS